MTSAKHLWGGILLILGSAFFAFVVIEGLARGEAPVFSRHAGAFSQSDAPAEFIASAILHLSLCIGAMVGGAFLISKYFYFEWKFNKYVTCLFLGYLGAVAILFFSKVTITKFISSPLSVLPGLPVAFLVAKLIPSEVAASAFSATSTEETTRALSYIFSFAVWWALFGWLLIRRARRA